MIKIISNIALQTRDGSAILATVTHNEGLNAEQLLTIGACVQYEYSTPTVPDPLSGALHVEWKVKP